MRHDISNQLLKVYRRWRRFAKSLQLRSTTSLPVSFPYRLPVKWHARRIKLCADESCAIRHHTHSTSELSHVRARFMHSDKLGWSTLYMKIKMKVHNYEVFFNRFRQRWMNFFLFILLWFLLKKHSKRLFYCILLRRKLIKLLILESNIS